MAVEYLRPITALTELKQQDRQPTNNRPQESEAMTETLRSAIAAINDADDAGLPKLRTHNGRDLEVAGLVHRVDDGHVHLDLDDVVAFRGQINRHLDEVASHRKREADARARAPLAADAPLTAQERQFDDMFADARARAAREATVEGKLDTLIAINLRIAEALEKR